MDGQPASQPAISLVALGAGFQNYTKQWLTTSDLRKCYSEDNYPTASW